MRDFTNLTFTLDELAGDIYPQPRDAGHDARTNDVLMRWLPAMSTFKKGEQKKVLDVGCGQGNAADIFDLFGWTWTGVTLGEDYNVCKAKGLNVYPDDFSFLDRFDDSSFDMVFARHSLEHSPIPLPTLFEWHRVCKFYLMLIVPSVEKEIVAGLNHYALLYKVQWEALLFRAGFRAMWEDKSEPTEYRLLCQRTRRMKPPYDYHTFTTETLGGEGMDLRDEDARK